MRGRIIEEIRFLHLGIDHHLFVTQSDEAEDEYRFEVRRLAPGSDQQVTEFEKTINFSGQLSPASDTDITNLLKAELQAIKNAVIAEDDIHAHDP